MISVRATGSAVSVCVPCSVGTPRQVSAPHPPRATTAAPDHGWSRRSVLLGQRVGVGPAREAEAQRLAQQDRMCPTRPEQNLGLVTELWEASGLLNVGGGLGAAGKCGSWPSVSSPARGHHEGRGAMGMGRPPCHLGWLASEASMSLQRNHFSDSLPQEPRAARSDWPESAWQEPSLLNPENIRCFLPAANKNLSFTLSVHLSWAPAGRDKAHRPLGAPGSLAPRGPVPVTGAAGAGTGVEQGLQGGLGSQVTSASLYSRRVTPSVQWCAEGRHGYSSVSAHTTLGTSREGAPPSRYPVGTPPLTAVLMLTPLRLPPYCLDCKHLLAVREAT